MMTCPGHELFPHEPQTRHITKSKRGENQSAVKIFDNKANQRMFSLNREDIYEVLGYLHTSTVNKRSKMTHLQPVVMFTKEAVVESAVDLITELLVAF